MRRHGPSADCLVTNSPHRQAFSAALSAKGICYCYKTMYYIMYLRIYVNQHKSTTWPCRETTRPHKRAGRYPCDSWLDYTNVGSWVGAATRESGRTHAGGRGCRGRRSGASRPSSPPQLRPMPPEAVPTLGAGTSLAKPGIHPGRDRELSASVRTSHAAPSTSRTRSPAESSPPRRRRPPSRTMRYRSCRTADAAMAATPPAPAAPVPKAPRD